MKRGYRESLHEDLRIRGFLKHNLASAGVSNIEIERKSGKVRAIIYTARPGIIIGRRGQEIDRIRDAVSDFTKSEVLLDIKEVKVPQIDAQLVAENIALQLEKRVSFRKAMKKAVSNAMSKGCGGIKIICKGRLGGAEIARQEGYKEGKVPLNTFRSNVDFGMAEAFTTYGTIGVKVWMYHGDVLVKKEAAERAKERQEKELHEAKLAAALTAAQAEPAAKEAGESSAAPTTQAESGKTSPP